MPRLNLIAWVPDIVMTNDFESSESLGNSMWSSLLARWL